MKTETPFDIKEMRHELLRTYLNVSIALQIRELRNSRGWTQEQLAKAAGIHTSRVCALEHVRWENWPTLNTLQEIAAAFDCALEVRFCSWSVALDEFLGGSEITAPPGFEEEVIAEIQEESRASSPSESREEA